MDLVLYLSFDALAHQTSLKCDDTSFLIAAMLSCMSVVSLTSAPIAHVALSLSDPLLCDLEANSMLRLLMHGLWSSAKNDRLQINRRLREMLLLRSCIAEQNYFSLCYCVVYCLVVGNRNSEVKSAEAVSVYPVQELACADTPAADLKV